MTLLEQQLSRADTKAGRLQRCLLEAIGEHERERALPTSGRFLFYELEQRGVVSKERTGARRADQDLNEALTYLRERGLIPWGWIVDESRSLDSWEYASSVAEYVARSVDYARINPWRGEPPAILCESKSLVGVLRGLAGTYLCPIAPVNLATGFLRTAVAPVLERRAVLYLGDYDVSGGHIEAHARRILEGVLERELGWRRLAITEGQIDARGLDPIGKTDRRYRPARRYEAWETEALGQSAVVGLVRGELEALCPALEEVVVREERERAAVLARLNGGAA